MTNRLMSLKEVRNKLLSLKQGKMPMTDNLVKMGRIAFREEGSMWNAYYALPYTMEGATHLGSIAMAAIRGKRARKEEFIQMMRGIVG